MATKLSNEKGIFLDTKFISEVIKRRLAIIFTDKELKKIGIDFKKEIETPIIELLSKYSKKVPNRNVVKIVENVLLESQYTSIGLISIKVPFYSGFDIDPTLKEVEKVYMLVFDSDIFKKAFDLLTSGTEIKKEDVEELISKSMNEIEMNIPNHFYSIYGLKLILEMTKNIGYFDNVYLWSSLLGRFFADYINTYFNSFKVAKDDNMLFLSCAAVIANQYYKIDNYPQFLSKIAEFNNIPEKVVNELIQIKVTQYKKITQLPILLKNLGLYLIPIVDFIQRLSDDFKNFFEISIISMFHLLVAIILSQYPQEMVSSELNVSEVVQKIEAEVLKTV